MVNESKGFNLLIAMIFWPLLEELKRIADSCNVKDFFHYLG